MVYFVSTSSQSCGDRLANKRNDSTRTFSSIACWFLPEPYRFFLVFAHRACAAFLASSFRCSGVRAAIRAFTPLPLAAFPPFLPISRITLEIRSRLIASCYEELVEVARFWGIDRNVLICDSCMRMALWAYFDCS